MSFEEEGDPLWWLELGVGFARRICPVAAGIEPQGFCEERPVIDYQPKGRCSNPAPFFHPYVDPITPASKLVRSRASSASPRETSSFWTMTPASRS